MMNEQNNYLVEVTYKVTDLTKKGKKAKLVKKKKQSFIIDDLNSLEANLKTIHANDNSSQASDNVLKKQYRRVKTFCARCNFTYHNMLKA